jgi:hypothetical protein
LGGRSVTFLLRNEKAPLRTKGEQGEPSMLLGHLLCALLFGVAIATAGLLLGLSALSAMVALVVGANVGLAVGL